MEILFYFFLTREHAPLSKKIKKIEMTAGKWFIKMPEVLLQKI
jgi:hypothetical protein